MPFGDGTGPTGQGPMTGRGLGYCSSGYANPDFRRGGRRGCRNWYRTTGLPGWHRAQVGMPSWGGYSYSPTPEQEKEVLTQEKEIISQEINALKNQIKNIEKRIESVGKKK